MNERIDELIFQVGYTKLSYPDDNFLDGRYALTQEQLDKFAELIVRECARLAIEKQTENDIAGITSKNPAKDFAYAFIEHFGVEE